MTRTHRFTLALIIASHLGGALSGPTRLWAVEHQRVHFYTRIGSQQLDGSVRAMRVFSEAKGLTPELQALDIGAGMKYTNGGMHLQLGPRYDFTSPYVLPQQKVIMEGQFGVRW